MSVALLLLCGVVVCGLLFALPARADDDESRSREVTIESEDGTEVTFKSSRTAEDGTEVEQEIQLKVDSGLELSVSQEHEEAGSSGTETEREYSLRFRRLFAYGNDDPSTPLACHNVNLDDESWTLACAPSAATKGFVCTARSATVNLTAHIVGELVRRNNAPDLLPEGVEFDLSLAKPACTAGTKLGLEARFEGSVEVGREVDDDDDDDRSSNGEPEELDEAKIELGGAGAFKWLRTATINGEDVPVTTVFGNGDSDDDDVTFLFDTTAVGNVFWDPFLGVSAASPSSNAVAATSMALASVALAALML